MTDHSDALGGRLPLADPTDLVGRNENSSTR